MILNEVIHLIDTLIIRWNQQYWSAGWLEQLPVCWLRFLLLQTHTHTRTHAHTHAGCAGTAGSRPDSPPPPRCPLRWIWGWICLRGFAPRRSAAWSGTSPSPRTPRTPPRPSSPHRPPVNTETENKDPETADRTGSDSRQIRSTPETLVLLRPAVYRLRCPVKVEVWAAHRLSSAGWLMEDTPPHRSAPPAEPHGTLGPGVRPVAMETTWLMSSSRGQFIRFMKRRGNIRDINLTCLSLRL